ncbi:hypothetical protein M9H77_25892 [Catharanthus roseus]|uniref:Uncharacterized protein n=1 Tax=Catharanthus roseus TaxID=4058 RepID=A0ACC0A8E8_CATRO|nr:hypothetical protein M9H77_25892 [Catharanthus roseus]
MLNYKEYSSKSSHSRPDENSIATFFCTFAGVCNSSSSSSLLPSDSDSLDTTYSSSEWSFSLSPSSIVGYNIDGSSETSCVTAMTCSIMFIEGEKKCGGSGISEKRKREKRREEEAGRVSFYTLIMHKDCASTTPATPMPRHATSVNEAPRHLMKVSYGS